MPIVICLCMYVCVCVCVRGPACARVLCLLSVYYLCVSVYDNTK